MFSIDADSGAITLPQGDTALFRIKLNCEPLPEGSVAVFGVKSAGSRGRNLLTKVFDVEEDRITVRLTNHDTRELPTGNHQWDARIVTDPERDESGAVRAEDPGDNVYSIFSGRGELPAFRVTGVAADV